MSSQNDKDSSPHIRAAVIAGIFAVVASCIGGIFLVIVAFINNGFVFAGAGNQPPSSYQPTPLVVSTSTVANNAGNSQTTQIAPLIINDITNNNLQTFEFPTTSTPSSCAGAYIETGMAIIDYELTVPQSWAIIIDSWKAEWSSGNYQNNGILIITGEWQGNIKINIGAICAVPIKLLQANLEIRRGINNDGRPEYTLP